ncbi:MAG TPA: terminase large subunit, partial [Bacteroidia bacterium]|nr:terminase large subunit [Bacteroidia bacterium]
NGELYVHELLYRNGMQNSELFAFAQKHIDLKALTVADSAEPKTVDYLYRKGWVGLKAADKSADSVLFGINLLLDRKLNITAESLNLIKELRQYMWDTNKDGAIIHRPVKENDHAIDALRYLYAYPKKRGLVFA